MAYSTLFSGTGKLQKDEGIDNIRVDYSNSYTLYAFDLTPDLAKGVISICFDKETYDWN